MKRLIAEHFDALVRQRGIDKVTVTALIEDCAMRPSAGDKKLYVISSFEDCSAVVQNKLLKVVEEPPDGVSFLLGATTLSPVLPTMYSCCPKTRTGAVPAWKTVTVSARPLPLRVMVAWRDSVSVFSSAWKAKERSSKALVDASAGFSQSAPGSIS